MKKAIIILGILVTISLGLNVIVLANNNILSEQVNYTNSKTNETTVNGALDELFSAVDINEEIAVIKEDISSLKDDKKLINKIYPVGSIYISTSNTNPETILEGTKWERYGVGKTLLSTDDVSEQTGGSNTVTLTTNNLPSHSHSYTPSGSVSSTFTGKSSTTNQVDLNHTHSIVGNTGNQSANHTHSIPALSGNTAQVGDHRHNIMLANEYANQELDVNGVVTNAIASTGGVNALVVGGDALLNAMAQWGGAHSHTLTTNASTTGNNSTNHYHSMSFTSGYMSGNNKHSHTVTPLGSVSSTFTGTKKSTENTGSGTAINIQNPYITVYMWKRTA